MEEQLRENYSQDSEDDDGGDNVQPAVQTRRPRTSGKSAPRPTTWVNSTALPEYQHSAPDYVDMPFQYFISYFDTQIISHITYQTNLYAAQKDINTTLSTNANEIMTSLAILIYMGVC